MKRALVLRHVRNFTRQAWAKISLNLFWVIWAFLVGALVGVTPLVLGGR